MIRWLKTILHTHFGFSRAEARGVLVLLLLLASCLLIPQGARYYFSKQPEMHADEDIALLEKTLALLEAQKQVHDINKAHAAQLCTLPGIGPVLSERIVRFREKLGGFVSHAQYQEVYGLRPEVVKSLERSTYISEDFQPRQLAVNTATASVLAAHPYITSQQARSIVRYRQQHGPFFSLDDLGHVVLWDDATLEKLAPYLSLAP